MLFQIRNSYAEPIEIPFWEEKEKEQKKAPDIPILAHSPNMFEWFSNNIFILIKTNF